LADYAISGDSEDTNLLLEYAQATARRKKQQWSKGLRHTFGLAEEQSDAKLLSDEVACISYQDWRAICYTKSRDLILQAAQTGGALAVELELDQVRKNTMLIFDVSPTITQDISCR